MNLDIKDKFFRDGFVVVEDGDLEELASMFVRSLKVDKHIHPSNNTIQILSNNEMFGTDEVPWHNDFSHSRGKYDGSLLKCIKNEPDVATTFVDGQKIVEKLSEEEIDELEQTTAWYSRPAIYESCFTERQNKIINKLSIKRPLIFKHPISNKKVLYFSPSTMVGVDKPFDIPYYMSLCESFAFHHVWKENQVVMWDNLRFMHKRKSFANSGYREMHRIQFRYVA